MQDGSIKINYYYYGSVSEIYWTAAHAQSSVEIRPVFIEEVEHGEAMLNVLPIILPSFNFPKLSSRKWNFSWTW